MDQRERVVKMRHLKPRIFMLRRSETITPVVDPHGKPARPALISLAKILVWLIEEWYASLVQETKESLLICDRSYHDLLVDPRRYRYGGPMWAAALVGKLMPKPDLWVLLDAPVEILQARKQEVSPEESARQCQAYIALVRKQRKHVIVDASKSLDKVIADVDRAISKIVSDGQRG
jgi:thymidylate kinase